ncbi:MAG: ROK family protein [Lachnospiraceae bacterium]|nr:ROK family protein [Lachnospiraceae bacterium]
MQKYIAIDIGGTDIKYALMDEEANILEKSKVKTPMGEDKTLEDLLVVLGDVIGLYKGQIAGVAISKPGVIDTQTGHSYSSGALIYVTGQNLPREIKKRFGVVATVQNDGKCAALAELWKGKLKEVKNGAVVLIGTGIGGGIILDGKLYAGKRFSAGEFSMLVVDYHNFMEESGYWASISGVNHLRKLTSEKTGISFDELDGIQIFERANQGEEKVLQVLDVYTKNLGMQLMNLQILLDLDLIAIGGGISQQPLLLEYLEKNIAYLCSHSPLLKYTPNLPRPRITACAFHNDSNLIGALYQHINQTRR